jgi:hypothetical protein
LGVDTGVEVDSSEMLNGECRWGLPVEFGDSVKDIDSFLLFTLGQQELGRLVEVENEESQEENEKSHSSEDDEEISPTHVGLSGTTCFSGREFGVLAAQNIGITSVFGNSTVSDTGSSDHTDWLPHGEERNEVSSVLGEEFESDQGVDGDVSTKTNTRQEI